MKKCSECKIIKPETEFHKNKNTPDGLHYRCKKCRKKYAKKYYQKNRERILEYNQTNQERISQYFKEYRELNQEKLKAKAREYREKYPEREIAHGAFKYALQTGEIKKPNRCSNPQCNNENPEGHHEDYSKPLEVEWLCPSCHQQLHTRMRALI